MSPSRAGRSPLPLHTRAAVPRDPIPVLSFKRPGQAGRAAMRTGDCRLILPSFGASSEDTATIAQGGEAGSGRGAANFVCANIRNALITVVVTP